MVNDSAGSGASNRVVEQLLSRGEGRWYLRTVEQTLSFVVFFFFLPPSLLFRPEQINGSLIQLEPGFSQCLMTEIIQYFSPHIVWFTHH